MGKANPLSQRLGSTHDKSSDICNTEAAAVAMFFKLNQPLSLQGRGMSQWMLTCSTCGRDFPHSPIHENLTFIKFVLLHKPEFPSEGLALDCPHCGESGTYERHDLTYSGHSGVGSS